MRYRWKIEKRKERERERVQPTRRENFPIIYKSLRAVGVNGCKTSSIFSASTLTSVDRRSCSTRSRAPCHQKSTVWIIRVHVYTCTQFHDRTVNRMAFTICLIDFSRGGKEKWEKIKGKLRASRVSLSIKDSRQYAAGTSRWNKLCGHYTKTSFSLHIPRACVAQRLPVIYQPVYALATITNAPRIMIYWTNNHKQNTRLVQINVSIDYYK